MPTAAGKYNKGYIMFFVVDKPRLQRIIAVVREDRTRKRQGRGAPFLRIEAAENKLTISGGKVTATFPATVYEEGVLFLKTTAFRRLIRTFKGEKFLAFQVTEGGLRFGNVLMPFKDSGMVLFPNLAEAPKSWPPPPPKAEQIPDKKTPTLFDID